MFSLLGEHKFVDLLIFQCDVLIWDEADQFCIEGVICNAELELELLRVYLLFILQSQKDGILILHVHDFIVYNRLFIKESDHMTIS